MSSSKKHVVVTRGTGEISLTMAAAFARQGAGVISWIRCPRAARLLQPSMPSTRVFARRMSLTNDP